LQKPRKKQQQTHFKAPVPTQPRRAETNKLKNQLFTVITISLSVLSLYGQFHQLLTLSSVTLKSTSVPFVFNCMQNSSKAFQSHL